MTAKAYDSIKPIIWQNDTLQLLDQRLLPVEHIYLTLNDVNEVAHAITDMVVRGAPAIGITAAYGIVIAARKRFLENPDNWRQAIEEDLQMLARSRPTAVNLFWAIDLMREVIKGLAVADPVATLLAIAKQIHEDDIAANVTMGKLGAQLIEEKCAVLTHCNAGALATGGYGTALGVIRSAFKLDKISHVYADETRPWLQGARLTAWEMVQDNIPVSLLVEGAAAHMIKTSQASDKPIRWVIVGSDRIASNGDVANKIGTYALAVLARHHGIKFMVAAPTTTIDMNITCGGDIPIEERSSDEVLNFSSMQVAATGAQARNPAFDVTPAELVDAIVTEKGVVLKPDLDKIKALMSHVARARSL
ncbi:MAG: S-methyl-5-thioribose-1-phosphate isomerase [gamma proteobacterium symbiont of Bathyaustriella thionipta]|nr:S-methyl-5-thioribose-1-phosphate isomerase [gamma proteobacterium symbiont of Bathyaustriella thionipta]MCU7949548.1 S-methyl-5-thioribose-1-phosphate isomerase [gamma proteobacterium symbiont of Bathyaustriella thionipta]MCU7952330.1 S-methyl-5-thioribose-1-phosphate isomerase [gamma proteobacterium symbiont of Bathyaustriella thionipta]MCU7956148.1 S-methyl-5-thioribose-1-phosphate isomerase [gamma proteobacterium symbiont of Bathyaustriella thionipta]MCU7967157.1 S-methyl-5-thioribose-1-